MSIPVHVCASRAVARSERYEGSVPASCLPRLADLAPREMLADLAFTADASGLGRIGGRIGGVLRLQCQACLDDYDWSLEASVDLVMVGSEEAESRLLPACEPVMVEEDRVPLHALVEDEVLLALPLLRRCPACDNSRPDPGPPASAEPAETTRPFAALKKMSLKGAAQRK